jgi:hypothetical protein
MKWFPVWNRGNELDLLRKHCFPNASFASMKEMVETWGYIPRIALTLPKKFTLSDFKTLISASSPDLLLQAGMLKETGKDDTNHRLIHIIPDENFDDGSRAFASPFIKQQICDNFQKNSFDRMQQFFADASEIQKSKSILGSLLGKIFENQALQFLQAGGTFERRDLSTGDVVKITMEKKKVLYFNYITELKPAEDVIYVHNRENSVATDFYVINKNIFSAFNATINPKHNLILDAADGKRGLYRDYEALANPELALEFSFLVPNNLFEKFTEVPSLAWNTKKNAVHEQNLEKNRIPQVLKSSFQQKIKFYAISIPMRGKVKEYHTLARNFLKFMF